MTTHALRGRNRYSGKICEKIKEKPSIIDGLNYTRTTSFAYSYVEQEILINTTTLLRAIYWDLRAGMYQLSINGVNYDEFHSLYSHTVEEKWNFSNENILLVKGNYYDIRMTRTTSDDWRDSDSPGFFNGIIWRDIDTLYDGNSNSSFCAPLKIEGIIDN